MKRPLLLALPLAALALMGNSCEFRAGVNNLPPDERREEPRDGGGLIIVVDSGDEIDRPESEVSDAIVAAALSMSALASPAFAAPEAAVSADLSMAEDWPEPQLASLDAPLPDPPVGAIPEPTGLLLFAFGLGLTSIRMRRR